MHTPPLPATQDRKIKKITLEKCLRSQRKEECRWQYIKESLKLAVVHNLLCSAAGRAAKDKNHLKQTNKNGLYL